MKKYLSFTGYNTLKAEASNKENDFYIVITIMGEELQIRLDDKGFYRNLITKADQLLINEGINNLKDGEFKLGEGETRTPEQTVELWKRQEELENKYTIRCDYVVKGLNATELYQELVELQLADEVVGYSKLDEVVE